MRSCISTVSTAGACCKTFFLIVGDCPGRARSRPGIFTAIYPASESRHEVNQ